jgi:hypothetical protein
VSFARLALSLRFLLNARGFFWPRRFWLALYRSRCRCRASVDVAFFLHFFLQKMTDREENVYMAKLAEQVRRALLWDDLS